MLFTASSAIPLLSALLAVAFAPSVLGVANGSSYALQKTYSGSSFFDDWTFYGHYDNLTNGDVIFVNRSASADLAYVNSAGNAIIKVDNTSVVPYNEKRNTVRIASTELYGTGSLLVFDALHVPYGCSVWGAWWTQAPNWPAGGEIDIFEAVNLQTNNQYALHTETGCTAGGTSATESGKLTYDNCAVAANGNSGCTIVETKPASYGPAFTAAGGGVWATEFSESGISIWFFSRADVPADLATNSPTPSSWGLPSAFYPSSSCMIDNYFTAQNLILDITLCGDYAGAPAVFNATCSGVCYTDYVLNASSYNTAYFEIASIKTYQTPNATGAGAGATSGSNTSSNTGSTANTNTKSGASSVHNLSSSAWAASDSGSEDDGLDLDHSQEDASPSESDLEGGEDGEEMDEEEDDAPPPRGSLFYSDQSDESMDASDDDSRRPSAPQKASLRPNARPPTTLTPNRRRRSPSLSLSPSSSTSSLLQQAPARRVTGSVSASNGGPTPWAKTLKLEPKRVAVMQASLFQQPTPTAPDSRSERRGVTPMQSGRDWSPAPSAAPPSTSAQPAPSIRPPTSSHPPASAPVRQHPLPLPLPARPLPPAAPVPFAQSVTYGHSSSLSDASLSNSHSFHARFGPSGELIRPGKKTGELLVEKGRIDVPASEGKSIKAGKMLTLQLEHTPVYLDEETGVPFAVPHPELRFSHFTALFPSTSADSEGDLWKLGHALFDELEELEHDAFAEEEEDEGEEVRRRIVALRRKRRLEKWFQAVVRGSVEEQIRKLSTGDESDAQTFAKLFALLSGHQIARACSFALSTRNFLLATLLAQAGGPNAFRQDLFLQLAKWREYDIEDKVPKGYRKLLELLSGNWGVMERDSGAVCEGLDWKRAMGVGLWFGEWDGTVEDTVQRFDAMWKAGGQGVGKPLPDYLASSYTTGKGSTTHGPSDPLYQLLQLYSSPSHPLSSLLLPLNFSSDPLNYRLPWHLYILFSRVLRRRDFEDRVEISSESMDVEADEGLPEGNSVRADLLTEAFAKQLEAMKKTGDGEQEVGWVWAIFVLLHLEMPDQRQKAIESVLARHITSITPNIFAHLTSILKVPSPWISSARATLCKYTGDTWGEYNWLVESGRLKEALQVAVHKLAPEGVVRKDLSFVEKVLDPFVGQRVEGWDQSGKVFHDYVTLLSLLHDNPASSSTASQLLLGLLRTVPALTLRRGGKAEGPEMLDVCLAEMQSRLIVISASLDMHKNEVWKPSTLREADKTVALQSAASTLWSEAIIDAVGV